jgi:hypothetical protein
VLFVFDASITKYTYTGRIWVTRLNPTKWAGKSKREKWFQSKDDLATNFNGGTFNHMIVFRHCGGELPFSGYLQKIILDDPNMRTRDGADLYSLGYGALRLAMTDVGLDIPIKKRICTAGCSCESQYLKSRSRPFEMFVPQI